MSSVWIAVDENLPPNDELVLIVVERRLYTNLFRTVYLGYFNRRKGWKTTSLQDEIFEVVAWAPLPNPEILELDKIKYG